ncbi:MAG: hypothetical protein JWO62_1445, partial [Acidimicrobiaceae bacterium]|nr:hypothetical protein [Acidimicrobiaceae bacterium]
MPRTETFDVLDAPAWGWCSKGEAILKTRLAAGLAVGAGAALALAVGLGPVKATLAGTLPVSVKVQGNHLVDATGNTLVLRGVDRSGMEYACAQGWGMADGPMDQASVDAMEAWHVNAVRIPLNEDCWLGINGVNAAYSGTAYRQAVAAYVAELHHDGMIAILDLHWSAPGTSLAVSQQDMADAQHSPAFWTSVSTIFKSDPGVIFDLYNEPHDITWQCWAQGCTSPGYQTAGMQSLVDAVRSTGATQPVMIAPLGWAGATGGPSQYGASPSSGWLQWQPTDPDQQEILSIHLYNYSGCATASCWNATIAPIATGYPVVMGEFGETDCGTSFDTSLMNWDDAQHISYMAWAWNKSSSACGSSGPSIITDYAGDPTTSGAAVESHYRSVTAAPTTTTAPAPTTTTPSAPPPTTTTTPKPAPTTTTTTAPPAG